jgi:hypothetical protein
MPRKEFEAFTRLDASDVNTFLMDQSVMTFGSATARDAAIDTPVEGQVTYLTDIDSLTVYNGTQWVTNRPVMNFAGTAARGSAIPSPVEGMVTYLEDINLYQNYDATNWVPLAQSSGSGLIHIKTVTFSAVSGVDVDDVFSSAYKTYRVILDYDRSAAADILLRFRSVSGTSTVANYFHNRITYSAATGTITMVTASNQTGILVGTEKTSVAFDLYEVQGSGQKSGVGIARKPTRFYETALYGTTETTAFTGLNLSIASGNITGSIQVFGYKD